MKYKVGDKVKIKSLEWYNTNKDKNGLIYFGDIPFVRGMSDYCGKILTINRLYYSTNTYEMFEDMEGFDWNDGMIECLVESASDSKIISRANEAVNESFENGAKFERERLAKAVED